MQCRTAAPVHKTLNLAIHPKGFGAANEQTPADREINSSEILAGEKKYGWGKIISWAINVKLLAKEVSTWMTIKFERKKKGCATLVTTRTYVVGATTGYILVHTLTSGPEESSTKSNWPNLNALRPAGAKLNILNSTSAQTASKRFCQLQSYHEWVGWLNLCWKSTLLFSTSVAVSSRSLKTVNEQLLLLNLYLISSGW